VEAKDLLGLDVGQAHTGIARASSVAQIAVPLAGVKTSELIQTLQKLIKDQETEAIVIGLPRNLSSEDTAQTKWVRDWVADAKNQIAVPFYWQDEALTSKIAGLRQAASKKPMDEHAVAAAIILQDFLDEPVAARVPC